MQTLACFPEDAVRVCKLSGAEIALRQARLLTLKDCEEMLKQSIREAQEARDDHELFRRLELAARLVLVTCDVAVLLLEQATGGAGKAVSKMYDGGKLVVDAFAGSVGTSQGVQMLAANKAEVAALSAKYMGHSKASEAIGATKDLIGLSITLWDQVTGAAGGSGGAAGIQSAIRTSQGQLSKIQLQIVRLEQELDNC